MVETCKAPNYSYPREYINEGITTVGLLFSRVSRSQPAFAVTVDSLFVLKIGSIVNAASPLFDYLIKVRSFIFENPDCRRSRLKFGKTNKTPQKYFYPRFKD